MTFFLQQLSDSGFQNSVVEEVCIHQTSACKTFTFVMDTVLQKANIFVKYPRSAQAVVKAEHLRDTVFQTPSVRLIVHVQATCNTKEIFTSIDCQWPGYVHDGRIFKNPNIYNIFKNYREKYVLLGDTATLQPIRPTKL